MSEASRDSNTRRPNSAGSESQPKSKQSEGPYPALTVYDAVPKGMKLFPITSTREDPVLKPGEWAVIDPKVTELKFGGLYVIREVVGDHIWHVRKPSETWATIQDKPTVILAPVNLKYTTDPFYMGGPCLASFALANMVGRVVGVYQPRATGPARNVPWSKWAESRTEPAECETDPDEALIALWLGYRAAMDEAVRKPRGRTGREALRDAGRFIAAISKAEARGVTGALVKLRLVYEGEGFAGRLDRSSADPIARSLRDAIAVLDRLSGASS